MSALGHFRTYRRVPVDLIGSLRHAHSGRELRVRIVDLSLAGACFELGDESLAPHTTFVLQISASILWDPLVLKGEIVWSTPASDRTPAKAGAQFHHADAVSLFALFELLGSQADS